MEVKYTVTPTLVTHTSEDRTVSIVFYLFQSCRCFSVLVWLGARIENKHFAAWNVCKLFLLIRCHTVQQSADVLGSETRATLQFTAPSLWDTIACIIPQECAFILHNMYYVRAPQHCSLGAVSALILNELRIKSCSVCVHFVIVEKKKNDCNDFNCMSNL